MDIELLKTFLELSRTRHFGRTAENLYLTQSAVSARIRQIEETLGTPLFTRTRNDIQLTPAGGRLVKYAESILNTWNRARLDASLKAKDWESLAIGGMYSLWDIVLQDWLNRLRGAMPALALQVEAGSQDLLVRKLLDSALDVAFMWEPPQMAELELEEIGTTRLVMVSTWPGLIAAEAVQGHYIKVDWGLSFSIAHARHFPDMPPPALRAGLGRIALATLLDTGGSAYLAEPMVVEHLRAGRLHRVEAVPTIDRAYHAVYRHSLDQRRGLVQQAVGLLKPLSAAHAAARATST